MYLSIAFGILVHLASGLVSVLAAPSNAGPLQSTGVSVSATSSSIAVQSTQLPTGGLIKPLWIPVNMSLPLKDDINKAGVLWKDWYPHFSDIEAMKTNDMAFMVIASAILRKNASWFTRVIFGMTPSGWTGSDFQPGIQGYANVTIGGQTGIYAFAMDDPNPQFFCNLFTHISPLAGGSIKQDRRTHLQGPYPSSSLTEQDSIPDRNWVGVLEASLLDNLQAHEIQSSTPSTDIGFQHRIRTWELLTGQSPLHATMGHNVNNNIVALYDVVGNNTSLITTLTTKADAAASSGLRADSDYVVTEVVYNSTRVAETIITLISPHDNNKHSITLDVLASAASAIFSVPLYKLTEYCEGIGCYL